LNDAIHEIMELEAQLFEARQAIFKEGLRADRIFNKMILLEFLSFIDQDPEKNIENCVYIGAGIYRGYSGMYVEAVDCKICHDNIAPPTLKGWCPCNNLGPELALQKLRNYCNGIKKDHAKIQKKIQEIRQ